MSTAGSVSPFELYNSDVVRARVLNLLILKRLFLRARAWLQVQATSWVFLRMMDIGNRRIVMTAQGVGRTANIFEVTARWKEALHLWRSLP